MQEYDTEALIIFIKIEETEIEKINRLMLFATDVLGGLRWQ